MYEITFITKDEQDPGIKKTIEAETGKITDEQTLGRKKFAYTIKKEEAGFYTSYVFEIDPHKLANLDKKLRLNSNILRYLIVSKKEKIIPKPKKEKIPKAEIEEEIKIAKPEKIEVPTSVESGSRPEPVSPSQGGSVGKKSLDAGRDKEKKSKKEEMKPEKIETPKIVTEPVKDKTIKPKVEKEKVEDEEERLKALEQKLDELLKE